MVYLDERFRQLLPGLVLILSGLGLTLFFSVLAWIDIGVSKRRKRGIPRTCIAIILSTFVVVVVPFFLRPSVTTSANACVEFQEHLRKALWTYYHENSTTQIPTYPDLLGRYLERAPLCPIGSVSIEIPDYGKEVSCPNNTTAHYGPSCINQQEKMQAALEQYYADNRTTHSPSWRKIIGKDLYLKDIPRCPTEKPIAIPRYGEETECPNRIAHHNR